MNSIIEIVIYFIAVLGIFLTYMSLKNYDELYIRNNYSDNFDSNIKRIEIIIKTNNYTENELEEVIKTIKYGRFDNLSNIVDNIKVENSSI